MFPRCLKIKFYCQVSLSTYLLLIYALWITMEAHAGNINNKKNFCHLHLKRLPVLASAAKQFQSNAENTNISGRSKPWAQGRGLILFCLLFRLFFFLLEVGGRSPGPLVPYRSATEYDLHVLVEHQQPASCHSTILSY